MPPIFTLPDIAALVTAFPPPLPTRDQPSLVKSYSGNSLIDSGKVLIRFRTLLETSPDRVMKADLPSRLGIERADWLLDCYDGELYYSKDLQSLLSTKEAQDVADRVRTRAQEQFVHVGDFAAKLDVSRQSCDRLLASESNLRHFSVSDGRQAIAENTFVDRLKQQIRSAMKDAKGVRVDLTLTQSSIPVDVLLKLAEEVVQQDGDGGRVAKDGDGVLYATGEYQQLQKKKQEELRQSKTAAAVNDLATDGFCEAFDDASNQQSSSAQEMQALALDVMSRFQGLHPDVELTSFSQVAKKAKSALTIIAKELHVSTAMKELDDVIQKTVRTSRQADVPLTSLDAMETLLYDETSHLGLTKRLLNSSEHRQMLEASMASASKAVQHAKIERFASICRDSFVAPLELYSQGLQTVSDETLNDRLSHYICEHFRVEVLPILARAIQKENLHDKGRAKDLDKLSTVATQAKTLADIQSAARKFCRKQKIETLEADELSKAKQEVLREKLRTVKGMSRGSDVLQNFVWILLAQNSDGLFLSSGKDTSRMIKHYQSVGDVGNARKLERWRDALKAGKQSGDDVQEMKAMAEEVIETMYGNSDSQHEG